MWARKYECVNLQAESRGTGDLLYVLVLSSYSQRNLCLLSIGNEVGRSIGRGLTGILIEVDRS